MSSYSYLTLARFEVDWGRNDISRNHSELFKRDEVMNVDYYYANNEFLQKPAFVNTLNNIIPRLELLGYTIDECRSRFDKFAEEYPDGNVEITFEDFEQILQKVNVDDKALGPNGEDYPDYYDFGEFARQFLFGKGSLMKFKKISEADKEIGHFLDNIDPYIILRLLGLNKQNLKKNVCWKYYDLVESGWENENQIYCELSSEKRYLIITEGSTDSYIIKSAFEWLMPNIAHFFEYIDTEKNYPFSGSSNLTNFYHGLCKIKPNRDIIFIFDNDTAGKYSYSMCKEKNDRIKIFTLPNHSDFDNYKCVGPDGSTFSNINGRAVSIELFLDTEYGMKMKSEIRWTSYDKYLDTYQGELIHKDDYTKLFKKALNSKDKKYNTEKLIYLLNKIVDICKGIRA